MNDGDPVSLDEVEHLLNLPCGHRVRVPPGVPVIGVSGPILDHRDRCDASISSQRSRRSTPARGAPTLDEVRDTSAAVRPLNFYLERGFPT
jgi:hypothetical protein